MKMKKEISKGKEVEKRYEGINEIHEGVSSLRSLIIPSTVVGTLHDP